ncbi:nuclear receptor coactivator 7 isoform X2 [Gambusia affinis]|uniref:nuclear receptor coactivator 7 isoform X2 n=1 Tax=Gambusia affinis TaxID=33528 RepID=UPI001CDC1A2A|nr:nuclear receptor coactivator 7 isoform X2 [Gambusia affinis]
MAQSVRQPETLGAAKLKPQADKTRSGYFCNVKSSLCLRLGSKLPAGVSQPPRFAKPPWENRPQSHIMQNAAAGAAHSNDPVAVGRPLDHVPHIRNPKLRQYYLQGTAWERSNTVGLPADGSTGLPGDTVFSVSSTFSSGGSSGEKSKNSKQLSSDTNVITELVSNRKDASVTGKSSQLELDCGSKEKPEADADQDCLDSLPAQTPSPSPEAEYDKLLDVEAVPLPDGHLCLLALPPECCQGERPAAMLYLKLFCRYITDGKGVVSGILVVTPTKIFFDPSKTHPLVTEHGFEDYLLSCAVDSLASVSFFSDVSHVRFSTSQQRRGKAKNIFQKLKSTKSHGGKKPEDSPPALVSAAPSVLPSPTLSLTNQVSQPDEADSGDTDDVDGRLDGGSLRVLTEEPGGGLAVLSSAATFCCGGPEGTEKSSEKSQTEAPRRPSAGSLGGLMFVRLRVQSPAGKKKRSANTLPRRDTWLALTQESSDELRSFLKLRRPDLRLLDGEEEPDHDEEEFVLIEDKGEEDAETFQTLRGSGDDWEMVLMEENKEQLVDRDPEGLGNVVENSRVLQVSHVRELCKELPARTVGRAWQLAYSTWRHGASLKCLYRKLRSTDSPVLIVIKDALDELFGAFLSDPLKPSETFYGTGETFLFMLHPRFKSFRWTGENSFFIKGDLDCFAVGGGSGHFGLWVDENLYLGRSSPCYTFNNCCLSETDDFRIMELEVWTFS